MNKSVIKRCAASRQTGLKRLGEQALALALLGAAIALVTACQPQPQYFSKNPICQHPQNSNDYCSFTLGEYQFWLSSNDPVMPIETGVDLHLHSEMALAEVQAEVRGVSMYMGRLPVVGELDGSKDWRAELYLGACTDPQMVWELRLAITMEDGETLRHRLQFQSYIPE